MQKPSVYKNIIKFKALEILLETVHIEAIRQGITQSGEHAFSVTSYATENGLVELDKLKKYGVSAFDQGTIQDIKHHERADEIYFILEGSMKIFWKPKCWDTFHNVFTLADDAYRYAYIPSGHCLVVSADTSVPLLAIALKTEKSTIKSGGKKLGSACLYYQNMACPIRLQCETLYKNRQDFFAGKRTRAGAVQRVNEVLQKIKS